MSTGVSQPQHDDHLGSGRHEQLTVRNGHPDEVIDQHPQLSIDSPTHLRPATGDRKARKKDQNRRAAYNYRRKKSEEKNRLREEEMRLVYSRVCLLGYADQIEGLILYILNTKTAKTLDGDGNVAHFVCPLCQEACDNILDLRAHLRSAHQSHEYGDHHSAAAAANNNNHSELSMASPTCNLELVNSNKLDE